ncbi:hypothetical protein FRB93_001668 [Tulasnella sp. JGI-2019a]|nr:hypothetical protein FRB93_001668 [Tulasnella sp. JGI-2019a]
MQSTGQAIGGIGCERESSTSSSNATIEIVIKENIFSSSQWEGLKDLPYVIVPARWEPSDASEARATYIRDVIGKKLKTDRKAVSSVLTLLTSKVSGFVTGAEHWGEEIASPVKVEQPPQLKEFNFATAEEELEARQRFGAATVEDQPWVPAPRPSNKGRKLSVANADSTSKDPEGLPSAREVFDEHFSSDFLIPSTSSHVATSTPFLGRLRPASIPNTSPAFREAISPFSSPPSSSQRRPMREHVPRNVPVDDVDDEERPDADVASFKTAPTSQGESMPSKHERDHSLRSSPRPSFTDGVGWQRPFRIFPKTNNQDSAVPGEEQSVPRRRLSTPSSFTSTGSPDSRAPDMTLGNRPAPGLDTLSNVVTPIISPVKRQRDALRFQSLEQTQPQEHSPRRVTRPGGSSSSAVSNLGLYESQYDYDGKVDAIQKAASAEMKYMDN